MRSSRWNAQGNIYLVTEESPLTAETVRTAVDDTDGILEVLGVGEDWVEIAIWNPDGSQAEMSGNGTRIAARWLSERTGATDVTVTGSAVAGATGSGTIETVESAGGRLGSSSESEKIPRASSCTPCRPERKSRRPRPSERPTSGSRFGPSTKSATTRISNRWVG